jgi:hypothetical protein
MELAPAASVDATDVRIILLPSATSTRFPFVAVILPAVAVREVVAVSEPVTAVFPVAFPIFTAPVPPVPIVVTPAPLALMLVVPATVKVPGRTRVEERDHVIVSVVPTVLI